MTCEQLEAQIRELRRTINSLGAVIWGIFEALVAGGVVRRRELLDAIEGEAREEVRPGRAGAGGRRAATAAGGANTSKGAAAPERRR